VVQLGGIVTMASLGGFMFVMFRRDIRLARNGNLNGRDGRDLDEMDKG
jgi:protein SCO1/2